MARVAVASVGAVATVGVMAFAASQVNAFAVGLMAFAVAPRVGYALLLRTRLVMLVVGALLVVATVVVLGDYLYGFATGELQASFGFLTMPLFNWLVVIVGAAVDLALRSDHRRGTNGRNEPGSGICGRAPRR